MANPMAARLPNAVFEDAAPVNVGAPGAVEDGPTGTLVGELPGMELCGGVVPFPAGGGEPPDG